MNTTVQPIFSEKLIPLQKQGITHGFFTRQGGVSSGIYQSLNVGQGSHDNPNHVMQNRDRVANFMGTNEKHLINAYQIHSADALIVDAPWKSEHPKADALVTNKAGLAISILTADCGPVLFADSDAGVIGAAHAGWRGALGGVLENTIVQMEKLGAKRQSIIATLGPCIGPQHYEVTTEFRQTFIDHTPSFAQYFCATEKLEHFLFNLWTFILDRLKQSDVHASCLELCTYADEQRFFSYRRKTHRNEPDYGRQMSSIMLGSAQ